MLITEIGTAVMLQLDRIIQINGLKFSRTYKSNIADHNNIISKNKTLSADAKYIQICSNRDSHMSLRIYPGQKFSVTLVAIAPAHMFAKTKIAYEGDGDIQLRREKPRTAVNATYANVSYRLSASEAPKSAIILLYYDNSCDSLVDRVYLHVSIQPCPLGFELSKKEPKCICDKRLLMITD